MVPVITNEGHDAKHVYTETTRTTKPRDSVMTFSVKTPILHSANSNISSRNHENHGFHEIVWWHKANKTDRVRRHIVVWCFRCIACSSGEGVQVLSRTKGHAGTASDMQGKTPNYPWSTYTFRRTNIVLVDVARFLQHFHVQQCRKEHLTAKSSKSSSGSKMFRTNPVKQRKMPHPIPPPSHASEKKSQPES